MSTDSPISELTLDAESRAKKHLGLERESSAPCGCSVTVAWFSETSRRLRFDHCPEHRVKKDKRA